MRLGLGVGPAPFVLDAVAEEEEDLVAVPDGEAEAVVDWVGAVLVLPDAVPVGLPVADAVLDADSLAAALALADTVPVPDDVLDVVGVALS